MLRFLLLRVLPRRLFPLLALFEVVRLVRRWRGRNDAPVSDSVPVVSDSVPVGRPAAPFRSTDRGR